jgi:hypothetical protein
MRPLLFGVGLEPPAVEFRPPGPAAIMPFAYYARLSAARQRIYRKSDALESLELPPGLAIGTPVEAIRAGLSCADRAAVQAAAADLIAALVNGFGVPKVRVRVLARRPDDGDSVLHGLYEPGEGATPARITVWMRTAARRDVVAFRTFLRTLIHELCHHLDYELLLLPETFHTAGFYKRESSLVAAILAREGGDGEPQRRLI